MHAHSACLVSQSVSLLWSIQVRYDFSITSATSRFAWAQHSDYEIYLMPLMLRVTASAAPASFCQKQTYSPAQQLEHCLQQLYINYFVIVLIYGIFHPSMSSLFFAFNTMNTQREPLTNCRCCHLFHFRHHAHKLEICVLSTILYIPHNIVKKKAQITFRFLNPGLQLERLVYNPLYYESSVSLVGTM